MQAVHNNKPTVTVLSVTETREQEASFFAGGYEIKHGTDSVYPRDPLNVDSFAHEIVSFS